MQQIIKTFDQAKADFRPGDLILYTRSWKLSNILIERVSGSPFVHAALLDNHNHNWDLLETLQWQGCRRVSLWDQVTEYPEQWNHFQADPDDRWPEWDRVKTIAYARSMLNQPYGWAALICATFRQTPFLRLFLPPSTSDDIEVNGFLPYCSHYYGNSIQSGGVDMVPNRLNRYVDPGRLANSMFVQYNCTLVP